MPLDVGGFVHFADGPFTSPSLEAFKPVDPCSTTAESVRRQRTRSHPRARLARRRLPPQSVVRGQLHLKNTHGGPHQERRPWELPYHHAQSTPTHGGQPAHRIRAGRPPPVHHRRYARVTDHGVQQYVQSMGRRAGGLPHRAAPTSRPATDAVAPPGAAASTADEHDVVPLVGWRPHRRPHPGRGHRMSASGDPARARAVPRGWPPAGGDPGNAVRPHKGGWCCPVLTRGDNTTAHRGDQRTVCAPSQDRQRRADIKCGIKRGGSGADSPARPRSRPRLPTPHPRRPRAGARWTRGWWR